MTNRKPVTIDGDVTYVDPRSTLAHVVPNDVQSVSTGDGRIIPKSEFTQAPVPDSFTKNLTGMIRAHDKQALLNADAANLQRMLTVEFDPPTNGERRQVSVHPGGEYLVVRNFPLPNQYRPDHIDLLLVTTGYPGRPPVGMHVKKNGNSALIGQLERLFGHTFGSAAISDAEQIDGWAWICYHYQGNTWQYNARNLRSGDNIWKFLDSFYNELS
ncbi:MAG: hypothetical protein KDH88_19670 [Chromatiales bacterium]|nr:hypothetical protein [Chromatiales bacterium]